MSANLDPLSELTSDQPLTRPTAMARPKTPGAWAPDQLDTAKRIYDIGRQIGAPDDHIRAALSTGIVESGFRNVVGDQNLGPGNEAYGPFQQRPVAGWGTIDQVQNTDYAAKKFYQAAAKVPKYNSPGHLAAQVQRPRADLRERYDQELPKADELFNQFQGAQDPLSEVVNQKEDADPLSEVTASQPDLAPSSNRTRQAQLPSVPYSNDVAWHFGLNQRDFQKLTPQQQSTAVEFAKNAAATDEQKKAAGQVLTQNPAYQANNLAQLLAVGAKQQARGLGKGGTGSSIDVTDQPMPQSPLAGATAGVAARTSDDSELRTQAQKDVDAAFPMAGDTGTYQVPREYRRQAMGADQYDAAVQQRTKELADEQAAIQAREPIDREAYNQSSIRQNVSPDLRTRIVRPVGSVAAGFNRDVASLVELPKAVSHAWDYVLNKTGLQPGANTAEDLWGGLQNNLRESASNLEGFNREDVKALKQSGELGFGGQVVEGAATMSLDLVTKFALAHTLLGATAAASARSAGLGEKAIAAAKEAAEHPSNVMALVNGINNADKGTIQTALGMAQGYGEGKALTATSGLSKIQSGLAQGAGAAALTKLQGGSNEQAAQQAVLMGVMGYGTGKDAAKPEAAYSDGDPQFAKLSSPELESRITDLSKQVNSDAPVAERRAAIAQIIDAHAEMERRQYPTGNYPARPGVARNPTSTEVENQAIVPRATPQPSSQSLPVTNVTEGVTNAPDRTSNLSAAGSPVVADAPERYGPVIPTLSDEDLKTTIDYATNHPAQYSPEHIVALQAEAAKRGLATDVLPTQIEKGGADETPGERPNGITNSTSGGVQAAPPVETVHHSQLQPRDSEGHFDGPPEYPNVPERPETLAAQVEARGFTLIPKDVPHPPLPEGLQAEETPAGTVYYDPTRIDPETIRNTPTAELLGHIENKSSATTRAVVARDAAGNEVHASAVSPENEAAQIELTQKNFPGSTVESGGPELAVQVLADRQQVSPEIQQAFTDWKGRRAYIDGNGNYRIKAEGKSSGPVASWNKAVKAEFPNVKDFHEAATAAATPEQTQADYESQHGSADAPDQLLSNERAAELFDKIEKGQASEDETNEFRTLAQQYGVPEEAVNNVTSAASAETPEVHATGDETGRSSIPQQTAGGGNRPPDRDNAGEGGNVGRVTSVKNAVTEAERAERGLDDVERSLSRTDKDIWEKARRDVENGVVDPDKLAAEIVKKHRPLTDDETVQLLVRRTQLHNQKAAQETAGLDALARGDAAEAAIQNAKVAETERLLGLNEEADTHGGTQNARALRIRQLMAKDDYSLAAMERRSRLAHGVEELTPEIKAEVKSLHDQIARLTAINEKMKADQEAALTEQAVKKIIREEKFSARGEKRRASRKALDDDFDFLKAQLAAVWKKKPSQGIQPMGLAALDPEGIATKLVLKMARNRIQAGYTSAEGLVDSVHKEIADTVDLTKRQVSEMISGYGKTAKPSDDPVEVKLRELKSIIASNLGTADILERGLRPERRGMQRDKPTQEMREAARKMREALKANGMEVEKTPVNAEDYQKSALDAAKTRTRNRIEDLTKWIADGKRTVADKVEIIPDSELSGLKVEKEKLQKVFDAIKDPAADQKTIENSLRSVNKSITDLQDKIKSGQIQPVKTEKGLSSPELDAARAQQKALRDIMSDLRTAAKKASAPAPDPFEVDARKLLTAHKALNTRLEKQATEYQRRIDGIKRTGKPYEAPAKSEPFRRSEAERLFEERVGRIKQEFEEQNRKAAETPLGWAGRLIVGAGRAAKLTYVGTLGKLTSAAAGRIVTSPAEDLIGVGVGKVFPELYKGAGAEGPGSTADVAQTAVAKYGGHGGSGLLNDHIAGIERLWKSQTFSEMVKKLTTGKSSQDVLYGGKDAAHDTDFLGIPGQVHGTIKEPVRQVTFFRQFRRQLGKLARDGKDISQPEVQMAAAVNAQNDAMRSIFMQRNFISDGFNQMVGSWERSGKAGPKTLAFLARLEFPITRVPVNIVSEGLNYTFGLGRALGETGYRALTGGGKDKRFSLNESFKQMTPEQKDSLMRAYKKGGLGLAMAMWGYLQPQNFGGFYQKGDKRDKNEPEAGEMMFFGHRIPHWATHVPILFPAQMGSTFRRLMDAGKDKANPDANLEALGGTAKGIASQVPFYETPARFFSGMEGPRQTSRFVGEQARGFVPGFIQEAAKRQDINPDTGNPNVRTPDGTFGQRVGQTISLGIPDTRFTHGFSRPTVPMNERVQQVDEKQSAVDQMRRGNVPAESDLKSQGFTPSQIKEMQKDARLTPFQVTFSNAPNDQALDRFGRMDASQRHQVQTQMEHKAFALQSRAEYLLNNAKDADKQRRQDELDSLQRRFTDAGISPRDPKVDRPVPNPFKVGSSGFRAPSFR